jgi:sec-independent protein translocase protein TatB
MVSRAIGLLRTVRAFAENAKQDIRKELDPEFKNFEFEDLNSRTFVTKNLLSEDALGLSEIRNGTPRQ